MTKQELEAAAKELNRLHREMNAAIIAAEQYAHKIFRQLKAPDPSAQIDAKMSETRNAIADALYRASLHD